MEILTSSDALVTYASATVCLVAYLLHCQRRHVARKAARRAAYRRRNH